MFEMYTLLFLYFSWDFAIFQQYSHKIYQHARNVDYKITFFAYSLLGLAILQQYLYKISQGKRNV